MSTEIQQAFGHPSERAEATASGQPRDRISLRDYVTEVEIGAFQQERGVTQRIQFNIVVEVTTTGADAADDVDQILSYDRLTEAIAEELHAERLNLLETLAERVADRILLEPQALRVFVRIEKLDRGPGALGVEIVRARDGQATAPNAELVAVPHPRVVLLSNAVLSDPELGRWIDGLSGDRPLILCVGAPTCAMPQADHPLARRRIGLLALDQNAWVLAGRDKRCVVVGTRTELDWAMKHDRMSVWAPSKMVLDAVDGPDSDAIADVVVWFADHMAAAELVSVDVPLPASATVPIRQLSRASLAEELS